MLNGDEILSNFRAIFQKLKKLQDLLSLVDRKVTNTLQYYEYPNESGIPGK